MLKKIRLTLAILFWVLITWLLVDFTGTAHAYLGWMAKIQFVPALLALNVGALLFVVTLTLLMGRIYCSVICPLGVMQDAIAWLRPGKNKYSFSPAKTTLRFTLLVVACASLALGVAWIGGLIFPYSTYGRIVSVCVAPLYQLCLLRGGRLAEEHHSPRRGTPDVGRHRRAGLEERSHLVQHHLSRWHAARPYQQTFVSQNDNRCRQVQELSQVRA